MSLPARIALIAVALAAFVFGAGRVEAGTEAPDPGLIARGDELYRTACVSCHGDGGAGTERAPSLIGVGAGAADFQLRTGRMPAADTDGQPPGKPVAFGDDEIEALVAYVASLGDGPPIPEVDLTAGDLSEGGELFRANCAACHNAAGIGGALSYGARAPNLLDTEPVQIAEAIRTGPNQMPAFGPETFTDEQVDAITRHIRVTLADGETPGGFTLGRAGPVTEGFVAIFFGLTSLVLCTRWITSRRADRE